MPTEIEELRVRTGGLELGHRRVETRTRLERELDHPSASALQKGTDAKGVRV